MGTVLPRRLIDCGAGTKDGVVLLGRAIIQHPDDLVRLQEAIFTPRPVVTIETGVAHAISQPRHDQF